MSFLKDRFLIAFCSRRSTSFSNISSNLNFKLKYFSEYEIESLSSMGSAQSLYPLLNHIVSQLCQYADILFSYFLLNSVFPKTPLLSITFQSISSPTILQPYYPKTKSNSPILAALLLPDIFLVLSLCLRSLPVLFSLWQHQ